MATKTKKHVFFYYGDDVFSNFHRTTFSFAGVVFFCSEQALMWAKAMFFRDYESAGKIMAVKTTDRNAPFQCKMLGRKVSPYDEKEWSRVRYDIMTDILIAKFSSSLETFSVLDETGDLLLVEASPTDTLWGVGLAVDHPDIHDETKWRGRNMLGKALVRARTAIRIMRQKRGFYYGSVLPTVELSR